MSSSVPEGPDASMLSGSSGLFGSNPNKIKKPSEFTATDVEVIHKLDDVDSKPNAHHHTLGYGGNQAAPGPEMAQFIAEMTTFVENVNSRLNALENP